MGIRFLPVEWLSVTLCLACIRVLAQVPGAPGDLGVYRLEQTERAADSLVRRFELRWGDRDGSHQWLRLDAVKGDGTQFRVWLLAEGYPKKDSGNEDGSVRRYLLKEGDQPVLDYRHAESGAAVLPALGYWKDQLPRPILSDENDKVFPFQVRYLGHQFVLEAVGVGSPFPIPAAKTLNLPVGLQIGSRDARRDAREPRRFDRAPVPLVPYEPEDYAERLRAGQTSFAVPASDVPYVREQSVFYTGDAIQTLPFPEVLYRSNYLGPRSDYLDEPAVRTSFALLKQLREKPETMAELDVPSVFAAFEEQFERAYGRNGPERFFRELGKRPDVAIGTMAGLRENLWVWEVHLSSGAYQLNAKAQAPPSGIVYEGRSASQRDLPFFNSTTGAQIPTHDQQAWLDILYGALRGAARVSGGNWGISIYGQFQMPEVYRAFTYAYDLGASYFLFWTGARDHHVPYQDQLELSRFVRTYANQQPPRDLEKLRRAAEVMILYPRGYTFINKEPMWWLPPLNYERRNAFGFKYREILARVAAEIERCYRAGVAYDLAWDLEALDLSGYREVITIHENGRVHVETAREDSWYNAPRWPNRPPGEPPELSLAVSMERGTAPLILVAQATVRETTAPVFYTPVQDAEGIWRNTQVIWQLYGPGDLHYQNLSESYDSESGLLPLQLDAPGVYRLRASVVDRAGRSTVRWQTLVVE